MQHQTCTDVGVECHIKGNTVTDNSQQLDWNVNLPTL